MTQRYPLPLTAAMLAPANTLAGLPRYHGAGVTADWSGGSPGNDIDTANANTDILVIIGADQTTTSQLSSSARATIKNNL